MGRAQAGPVLGALSYDDCEDVPGLIDTDDEDDDGTFAGADEPQPPPLKPNPPPKWRSTVYIALGRTAFPALVDSGCTASCISHDFFTRNPCFQQTFAPDKTEGRAINGTGVPSVGEVQLNLWMEGEPMSIKCKVIKGLVEPVILGWDWMSKYDAVLDAGRGILGFRGGSTQLVESPFMVSSCLYKVGEDVTLPPFSKVHLSVELVHNVDSVRNSTGTVITEPFSSNGVNFWAARTCSKVTDNKFRTELINNTSDEIAVEAGYVIGAVEFIDEVEFDAKAEQTEMFCRYEDDALSTGEVGPPEQRDRLPPDKPQDDIGQATEDDIPAGAKRLCVDYSEVAKDAKQYIPRLKELIKKHDAAFSKHDRDYGRTELVNYRANLKDPDQPPLATSPYRTSPEMREVIDAQAHQMLADGLVGHSTSPFSAPILLAKKKCGGWRFLTDFRKINDCCNKIVYPLPRIEDSIQRLEAPRFFTSMDLTKGFWQIPVHKDDRKFFAFSTETMHLEYLVAPMGAKNSPSYLSALMQLVLRGLPIQHVISYLDDILVADTNMEDHLKHLDLVLSALAKAGLKLNPAKCQFARDSVVCLGHLLSRDGVSPDPANIEKIRSWKTPTNVKRLRTFLGLTGYYRQYVEHYSDIASCLTDLTRTDVKWEWSERHQRAFESLRDTLISEKVMSYPNFSVPFIVKSDASETAIGYVLTQKVDGNEKVISYGSKKLNQQQQNWPTYDREFFALVSGVRANAHYLRHNTFTAITDHRPLLAWKRIDSKKDPTGRRTRWSIELNNYDFTLIYKKGLAHADADAMSRRGDDDDEVVEDSDEFFGLRNFKKWRLNPPELCFLGIDDADEASIVVVNADDEARKRLRREQDADPVISNVKAFIKARRRPPPNFPATWYRKNFHVMTVKDDILYCQDYAATVHKVVLQAIIPDSMVKEVLSDLHGSERAGHLGVDKLLLKVKRYAMWPTLRRDVEEAVRNCMVCDQLRNPVPKVVTPLRPIVAHRVFDHVMCDLVTMPLCKGYRYVLVFKDVFSGYIRCYKLRNKESIGVVRALDDLACTLGPPKILSSDNGMEFNSNEMKQACRVLGVEKRNSVPYRPQSQGNVERQNRTLIQYLKQQLLDKGKTWVDHLALVEWIYNTSPYSRTQMAPYQLFFGRDPPVPPLAKRDDIPAARTMEGASSFEVVRRRTLEVEENRRAMEAEANRRAEEKRRQEAATYNRKVKHVPLEVGDKAWEKANVRDDKLDLEWRGPAEVERRSTHPSGIGTTYDIRRPDGSPARKNYEQLKKVNADYEKAMATPLPPKEKAKADNLEWLIFCLGPSQQPPQPAIPPRSPFSPPGSPTGVQPALPPPMIPQVTPAQNGTSSGASVGDAQGAPLPQPNPATSNNTNAGEVDATSGEVEATTSAAREVNTGESSGTGTTPDANQSAERDSTIQSLAVESATEHDTGFIVDSIEAGSSGLQSTPQNVSIGNITDEDMRFGPPRHPLVTEQFRRRLIASTDGDNVSSPGSSPDLSQPRRMAFGRGGGLPFIQKVEVGALPEGDDDDQNTFHTPGPMVEEYRAEEAGLVGDDDETTTGYIVHSNEGDVTVVRVSEEEADDEESPGGAAASAPPPQPPLPPLPPPEEQRQLQGKMRPNRRSRYNPMDYPRTDDDVARRRAQAQAQERDASGRFRAKSNSTNPNDR